MIKRIKDKFHSFNSFLKLTKEEQEKILIEKLKKRFLYFIELSEFMIYPIGTLIMTFFLLIAFLSEFTLEYYVFTYLYEIGIGLFAWIGLNDLLTYTAITLSKKWNLELKLLNDNLEHPYLLVDVFSFKNNKNK